MGAWAYTMMLHDGIIVDLPDSISELVKHGKNGLVFKTSEELAEQMKVCSHVQFPRPA